MVTYLKCTSLDTEYGIKFKVFRLALLTFQLDETASEWYESANFWFDVQISR
jgi:hypothetical protein